jgi:hypothetical protein
VRAVRLAALVVLAAALVPTVARADADPPSDFLLSQSTYLPFFGAKPSAVSAKYLRDVVAAANDSGYPIKVAVVGSRGDLGGVFSLYGHPKQYAPFLGRELAFQYRGRLLTSMPQGFGFYWYRHPTAHERRIVAAVPIRPGVEGLVDSTAEAVKRLAAADGHTIHVQKGNTGGGGGGSGAGSRLVIAVAGGVIIVALIAGGIVLQRRQSPAPEPAPAASPKAKEPREQRSRKKRR